jgi:hypothetical protein
MGAGQGLLGERRHRWRRCIVREGVPAGDVAPFEPDCSVIDMLISLVSVAAVSVTSGLSSWSLVESRCRPGKELIERAAIELQTFGMLLREQRSLLRMVCNRGGNRFVGQSPQARGHHEDPPQQCWLGSGPKGRKRPQ